MQITSTPAQYKMVIKHARLETKQDFQPSADVTVTAPTIQMKSQYTTVKLDTRDARRSLGQKTVKDLVYENAANAKEYIKQKTHEYTTDGELMSHPENGRSISDIVKQKVLQDVEEKSQTYTMFLPSGGVQMSWEPAQLDRKVTPGDTKFDWQLEGLRCQYIPGDVSISIVEHARVDIKYVGGPLYFPPSSDPEYVEQEAV